MSQCDSIHHALAHRLSIVQQARFSIENSCGFCSHLLKKSLRGKCAGIQQRDMLDQNIVNLHMINCWIVENGGSTYPETKEDVLDATVCRWVAAPRREKGC